jgi:phage-related protein
MNRLLADAQKITGVKYDINNLSDVYSAIHVIQEELDITGTTAKEAASTISGSFASMKAAFKNVLGQLTLGQDVGPALQALAQTVTTFLVGNLLPAVWNILSALPGALVTFIQTAVPQLVSAFMQFLPQMTASISAGMPQMVNTFIEMASESLIQFTWTIIDALPQVLETGTKILKSVIDGIASELPGIVSVCLDAITGFIGAIIEALPQVLQSGTEILMSLIDGIRTALPQMLVAAAQAILSMVKGLIQNFPQILSAGFDMIVNLIKGIGNALPDIIAAAGEIAGMLWDTILETDWIQLGKDIISGLINGIGAMAGALWDAAVNIARSALDAIKSFFGIASPSKLMRDEVGKFIPLGIAAGIERNTRPISKAMRGISELTSGAMNADIMMGLRYGHPAGTPALAYAEGYGGTTNFYQTINTHDSLSESELTREAENLLERGRWKNP